MGIWSGAIARELPPPTGHVFRADIRRLREWMGHADIQTTMRYLHYALREGDAPLVGEVFTLDAPLPTVPQPSS